MNNLRSLCAITLCLLITACTAPATVADPCTGALDHRLEPAAQQVEGRLEAGCSNHFDRYIAELLAIAEDRPDRENQRVFSGLLERSSDRGLISRRQAQAIYNRYFNIKFTAFTGDFNTCAQACPDPRGILAAMEAELADKETGLLRVSDDRDSYYRASNLLQQTRLVLQATCQACGASQ